MSQSLGARAVGALDVATGLLLLTRPETVVHTVGRGTRPLNLRVVRLLGVRSAGQGLALLAAPCRELVLAAGATDLLHASSMVALAAAAPAYRRAAVSSAVFAAFAGSLTLAAARAVPA